MTIGSYPRLPLDSSDWQRRATGAINYLLSAAEIVGDTAADIADVTAEINTSSKYEGKLVWDEDNHRLLRADGELATDAWHVIDGSASVTPA